MAQVLKSMEEYEDSYLASYPVPSRDSEAYQENEVIRQEKKASLIHLSKIEKAWIIICVIMALGMCIRSFMVMMNTNEQVQSMEYIQGQIQTYQIQSEELRSQIASQYNYDAIRNAAQEHDMTVDKERIGSLSE